MDMNVSMARTAQVSSAALRIAEREPGGMEGYTSALPKWTHTPVYFSQLHSVCLIWSTGCPTFTFKQVEKKLGEKSLTPGIY